MNQLFEGLAEVLAWLYHVTRSYGFSIILLTLGVRILVTPLTIKGTRSMMAMQKFQPEIRRLQQEHKGDRQRLNEELMRFYRENKINPMGSCLPLLIQMPVFLILYQVVHGITRRDPDGTFNPKYLSHDSELYQALDGAKDMMFLGMDLSRSALDTLQDSFVSSLPYLLIIAVVTATSYIQQKQVAGRNVGMDINPMQKKLMQFLPLTFAVFSFTFAAALGFYFLTSNLYQVAQQAYISRALYGMRRGKPPAEASAVVDTTSTETQPAGGKGGAGSSKGGAGSSKGGSSAAPAKRPGSSAGGRSSNGRVTGAAGAGGNGRAGNSGRGGRRNPGGQAQARSGAGGRSTSGRVTEPKRSAGTAGGTGSGRAGSGPPPQASRGGQTGSGASRPPGGRNRRRVPFTGSEPGDDGPASGPEDPQRKRRG